MQKFEQVLQSVLFFNTFSTAELSAIVAEERLIKWKKYNKGSAIFKEGTFDQHFYIIIQGKVEIIKADSKYHAKVVGTLQQGDILGEMVVCLPEGARTATAQVCGNEEAIICEIDATLIDTVAAPIKAKLLKKFLDLILERLKTAERDLSFYQSIIDYAAKKKLAAIDEFFLYSVETAINDNNRFTQYIKYTDFLITRLIPPEQAASLLRNLLIQATEKLTKFLQAT